MGRVIFRVIRVRIIMVIRARNIRVIRVRVISFRASVRVRVNAADDLGDVFRRISQGNAEFTA